MKVPVHTVPYNKYVGTGLVGTFPITYPVLEDSTLEVFVVRESDESVTLLEQETDYTLTGIGLNGDTPAGELTLVDAYVVDPMMDEQAWITTPGKLKIGYTLFIKFSRDAFQDARFRDLGRYSPEVFGNTLGRLTMFVVALKSELDRTVKFSDYSAYHLGESLTAEEVQRRLTDLENVIEELTDGDTVGFTGFSARFNEPFDTPTMRETLAQILQLSYLGPQVSLAASGSGTIREKGTAVTSSTLAASVTKRSDPIARILFKYNGVAVSGGDYTPPASTGTQVQNHSWTGSFSDNVTFSVEVTDDGTTGGPTTVTSTASFTFVYPYFSGAGVAGKTAAQVAALTKSVITSTASLTKSFTSVDGDVYYFAYPASYGALTSIKDVNLFETIGDWTATTANITGLDGNAVSYRIYEFNNPVVAGTTSYTFTR